MRWLILICVACLALMVSGCGAQQDETATTMPATEVPPPTATEASPTTAPTPTDAPTQPPPSPTPTNPPASVGAGAELIDQVQAAFAETLALTVTTAPTSGLGINGVSAFPLESPSGWSRFWAVHTIGLRNFDTDQPHVVAIYTQRTDGAVEEVTRLALVGGADQGQLTSPDYLGEGSVAQAKIEPGHIWLTVEGGAGAHSGVFQLLRFDGQTLAGEIGAGNSAPGVGGLLDINNDGLQEVTINASDFYVFCYACGVRLLQYDLWRWNGERMEQVTLQPLPTSAPLELQTANDTAIELAEAGLWKDALKTVEKGLMLGLTDPSQTFAWNASLIRLNADAKRTQMNNKSSAYPLLDHVFYGDYPGAVNLMRPYLPEEIFSLTSPLISGTVAAGWEESLASWLDISTTSALGVMPDLAPAHFLAGWAAFLVGDQEEAVRSVARAAQLDPDDKLYGNSLVFLGGEKAQGETVLTARTTVNVRSGPGASFPVIGDLPAGTTITVTGQSGAENDRWWQIVFPSAADERGWVTGDTALVTVTNGANVAVLIPQTTAAAPAGSGRIFFSAPNVDGANAIYSLEMVEGAQPVELVVEAAIPAVQPQAERLAFTSLRSDMLGVGGIDLSTGERLRFSFNIEDTLASWNAEGNRLAFASTRESDRRWRLYLTWADGAGNVDELGYGQDPDWHPSADRIVFKGCDDAGANCGLWTMASDGSARQSLTNNPGDSRPRWSPDGQSVVFMSNERDGNWDVYRVSVASGEVVNLTVDPANDGLPVFSPDGAQIAFVSDRGGQWGIFATDSGSPATLIYAIGANLPNWLEQGLDWAR